LGASAYATIHCAVLLRDEDLRKGLGSVQTPTLILHGTDDRLCPFDLGKKMNEGIKGSKLIAVENAGHVFCYEERERVNSELVRFIG
jgi:pimeloyl-ACP methyl ester carboxylesterase